MPVKVAWLVQRSLGMCQKIKPWLSLPFLPSMSAVDRGRQQERGEEVLSRFNTVAQNEGSSTEVLVLITLDKS